MQTILIIDDDDDYRETVRDVLFAAGYDVYEAACPVDAYPILEEDQPDLIICDLHMPFTMGPDQDQFLQSPEVGFRTIKELAWVFPTTPVIAMSSIPSSQLKRIATHLDPIPTFAKPIHTKEMVDLVEHCLVPEQVWVC